MRSVISVVNLSAHEHPPSILSRCPWPDYSPRHACRCRKSTTRGMRQIGCAVAQMGAVPQRAPVGHGARGLQRQRRRMELLHATTRRAHAPTAGARTDSPASATTRDSSAWRWRCGTASTRFSRSGSSASPTPRATTVRTSRSTTSISTPRRRTPISAGSTNIRSAPFPYDDLVTTNRDALAPRAGIRAARYRRVRRRPLLRRRRRVRQGGSGGRAHARHGDQPRPARRRRCTCCRRSGFATSGAPSRTSRGRICAASTRKSAVAVGRGRASRPRRALAACARRAAAAVHRERDQPRASVRAAQPHALRQGRVPSPADRRRARPRSNPAGSGTKASAHYRARRSAPASSATVRVRLAPTQLDRGSRQRRRLRRDRRGAAAGGRRVLRRHHAGEPEPGRAPGGAPGARRHAVEQAALLLRPRRMARRPWRQPAVGRTRAAAAATCEWFHMVNDDVISMPDKWEYPWYAAWDLAFHTPAAGAGRPRLRQAAAAAHAARRLHAPERPAAGLRVELRRRQPAGARLGGVVALPHRAAAARRRRSSAFCATRFTAWRTTSPGG